MTGLWDTAALVALLLTWLAAPSSSLADVARREAVRRQLVQAPRVSLSNATLPAPRPVDVVPASSAGMDAPPGGEPGAGPSGEPEAAVSGVPGGVDSAGAGVEASPAQAPAGGEQGVAGGAPPAAAPTPEEIWRQRAAALRLAIVTDAATERDLESRVARLEREATSRDDPAQRAMLIDQLSRARGDLAKAREKSRADTAAESRMREEARRAGVPPGWLR